MELNQKRTGITDIYFSTDLVSDFFRCCDIFLSNDSFVIDGRIRKKQVWLNPHLVKHFVKNRANQAIVELVFETICSYEKRWPGSGLLFLHLVKNDYKHASSKNIRGSSSMLVSAIQKIIQCDTTKEIFQQIRKYGNPQLSISVQRLPVEKPLIKFINTPSIRLRLSPNFRASEQEFKNCYFFMVNGAVAKSSELTRLLNESFQNKDRTYFLVCKSFNEEIIQTLQANYDRQITNVIPIEFGFDLNSINSLADLQSIIGGLPFSSDLGDVLSAADFSRLGFSSKVILTNQKLIIKPSKDNRNHLKKLSIKLQDSNLEKRKVLSKRLISLKGNSCNIFLPKNSVYDPIETNVRHSTLLMHGMAKSGVTEIKIGKNKFYIPATSYTIIPELRERVEDLLTTKVFLPRR